MIIFSEADWQRLLPPLRERCPRLTSTDLDECERRSDLLAAKIQNRHWISRVQAQAQIDDLIARTGIGTPT